MTRRASAPPPLVSPLLKAGCPQQVWERGTSTTQPDASKSCSAAKPSRGRIASARQVTNSPTRGRSMGALWPLGAVMDSPPCDAQMKPGVIAPRAVAYRSSVRVRTLELALRIESDAEARFVQNRSLHAPILGNRLVQQQRRKRRQDLVGIGRGHDDLGERAIMARDDEMIAVHAGAMRNHQRPVRIGER